MRVTEHCLGNGILNINEAYLQMYLVKEGIIVKYSSVILIGFMGSGKSTIGKPLAAKLGWTFTDLDKYIEQKEEKSIQVIFQRCGEPYFREIETQCLTSVLSHEQQVIATGGGAVLAPGNRDLMLQHGLVVALTASKEVLIDRLKYDRSRPLLQGEVQQKVEMLLEQRKHVYQFAHLTLDTSHESIDQIVDQIFKAL